MKYDSVILGFGKGGKTLAGALAARGERVALIERDPGMYGGTCINVGCIPSKSLVRSAGLSRLDEAASFEEKAEKYRAAIAEKRRLTALLRGKNYHKLADAPNVTVVDGAASFEGPHTVRAEGPGGAVTLEGAKLFINTGAVTAVPALPGIEGNPRVYTSESLMELEELPRRLTIVGGGYIGLEFASMYAGFGSQVTVIQRSADFIPKEDRDVADEVRKLLEAAGVRFLLGAPPVRAEGGDLIYRQDGAEARLPGDAILLAAGRRPNTDGLRAELAGVELTDKGAVKVDDRLHTTAPDIWAMGDVTGGAMFTYTSLDDYRVVLSQLFGDGSRTVSDRKNTPYCVFMAPPLARVGLTEAEARARGLSVRVAKLPAAAIPKAQVLKSPAGLLKAVVDADSGRILGASLLCEESYEIINLVKLAMDLDAPYTVLRDRIYTHPTMTEALNDLFSL